MVEPFELAEYVGFTEEEVVSLCKNSRLEFVDLKKWYDGYSFKNAPSIYNPNSIMKCMKSGEYLNYWSKTKSYESLKVYIDMDFEGIRQALLQIMGGNSCKVNTHSFQNDMVNINSKDDVFTLLIHLGYLAYNPENKTVRIPNEEIRDEFKTSLCLSASIMTKKQRSMNAKLKG